MGLPLRIVKPHPVHKDEWGPPPLFNSFLKNLSISVYLLKNGFMTCRNRIRPYETSETPKPHFIRVPKRKEISGKFI